MWEVLADNTRVGEWSHECRSAARGRRCPAPGSGACNRGARGLVAAMRDRHRRARAGAVLAHVRSVPDAGSTLWRITLEPEAGGTRIRQEYTVLTLPALTDTMIAQLLPAHRDRTAALREDLLRLGRVSAGVSRTR